MQIHLMTHHVAEVAMPTFLEVRRTAFLMRGTRGAWEGFAPYLRRALEDWPPVDATWHAAGRERILVLDVQATPRACFVLFLNGTTRHDFDLHLPTWGDETMERVVRVRRGEDWETPPTPLVMARYRGVVYPLPPDCLQAVEEAMEKGDRRVLLVTEMPGVLNPPLLRRRGAFTGKASLLKEILGEALAGWQTVYRVNDVTGRPLAAVYGWTTWVETPVFPPTAVLVDAANPRKLHDVEPDAVWTRYGPAWFTPEVERAMTWLDARVTNDG